MSKQGFEYVDRAVEKHGRDADAVIAILQDIQEHAHYLPPDALQYVCEVTEIRPAAVIGVASFYDQFRFDPAGEHRVRICHGTACHVKGATIIQQAIEHYLKLNPGEDTDAVGKFTVEKVACLGCCTLAPVVQIDDLTYGHIGPDGVGKVFDDFELALHKKREAHQAVRPLVEVERPLAEVRIGLGSCCAVKGSDKIYDAFCEAAADYGVAVKVQRVGCVGMCHRTPMVEVVTDGRKLMYTGIAADDVAGIMANHFRPRGLGRRIVRGATGLLDRLLGGEVNDVERYAADVRDPQVSAFLGRQKHIATEHFGVLDPTDLRQYQANQGFMAIDQCLQKVRPGEVVDAVVQSGLRGRGGGGFITGRKWGIVAEQQAEKKYIVCNGDEGDPGAFMDRMILESFPYRVIEGMMIAGYAVGANQGIIYVRHEYPLAVERVEQALAVCYEKGILGRDVLGQGWSFDVEVREGAGAFVCGEETALIASVEGKRGMPVKRPPYPAVQGLWGRPTLVNNVETLSMVPWIMRHGADTFAALGTEGSSGTKVFALAGKVERGGLIEVEMGVTIREIVEEIGGGVPGGGRFKAVQIGGPSGGCIPEALADTPVDFDALQSVGAIMGSGGLVVLDEKDCMVDLARYFLEFTQAQSCGKCTFCRIGTRRMLDILERICSGHGRAKDLDELEVLARDVQRGSLCGLGSTAPNPVLTTLKYFRKEYEAHLQGRCPAGRCKDLVRYVVNDHCVGCTICAQKCPADAIAMRPWKKHRVDDEKCTRCDTCVAVCPHDAIDVE